METLGLSPTLLIWIGIILFIVVIITVLLIPSGNNKDSKTRKKHTAFELPTTDGVIKFFNPFVNFLVYGGAGSGKTASIGKPLLREYIKYGFSGFIYDYKDFDYTKTSNHLVKVMNYPHKFYYVSFTDMNRTYRTNIIDPKIINDRTLFLQLITDLFKGLAQNEKDDGWYHGALGILKGVALRFYKEYPDICTIPHICYYICSAGKDRLTEFLLSDTEYRIEASAFIDARDSEKTQASYLSSLTNYLSKIANNREIAWVLTGNKGEADYFDFNLIDPVNPKLCAVANSFQIEDAISPIISVMVGVSARRFSLKNKIPFFFAFDEATTTPIPDFEKYPSVLREYRVSMLMLTQSSSKIEKLYGKMSRASIESNFGNQFYGRTMDVLALQNYQSLFGKEDRRFISKSTGMTTTGSSRSKTVSQRKEERYDTKIFTDLRPGEFIGTASEASVKDFRVQFKMYNETEEEVPIVRVVLPSDIERNYEKIKETLLRL